MPHRKKPTASRSILFATGRKDPKKPHARPVPLAVLLAAVTGSAAAQTVHNTAATGNWTDTSVWQGGAVPNGASFTAAVDALGSGAYTITLDSTNTPPSITLANLALNSTNATVTIGDGGTLDLSGSATLSAGALQLTGGTIVGGNFTSAGGLLQADSSTNILQAVNLGTGVLDLSPDNSQVQFTGGTSLASGTYNMGNNSGIYFNQNTTLTGQTINFNDYNAFLSLEGNGNTLNIGTNSAIVMTGTNGGTAYITAGQLSGVGTPSAIINQGRITVASGSSSIFPEIEIDGPVSFTNQSTGIVQANTTNSLIQIDNDLNASNVGTIAATATGSEIDIDNSGVFTNTGTISASNGGTVHVSDGGNENNWNSTGTFVVNNGTLILDGFFSTAGMGTINRTGGTIQIAGELNNNNSTLNLNSLGALQLSNSQIDGGTVTGGGSAVLQPIGGDTRFAFGTTLNNVSFGPGVLDLTGNNAVAILAGTTTIPDTTITLGNAAGIIFTQNTNLSGRIINTAGGSTANPDLLQIGLANGDTPTRPSSNLTLTIGSNTVVNVGAGSGAGQSLFLNTASWTDANHVGFTSNIVNNGTIQIAPGNSQGSIFINGPGAFTNAGTISASTANSEIFITNHAAATNSGTIRASGANTQISIQSNTFTNAAGGLLDGSNAGSIAIVPSNTSSPNWSNQGTIMIGGLLELGGNFRTADIGTLVRGPDSQVVITGALDNSNATLTLSDSGPDPYGTFTLGGTITGGNIVSSGSARLQADGPFGTTNNILNNVNLAPNVLDLSPDGSFVRLQGTTTLPLGTLTVGRFGGIIFEQNVTLAGYTFNLGNGSELGVSGHTLTLAPSTTVNIGAAPNDSATILAGYVSGSPHQLINQTTLRLNPVATGGQLIFNGIGSDTLTNSGLIDAAPDNSFVTFNIDHVINSPTGTIQATGASATVSTGFITFTNNGTLLSANGSTVKITDNTNFTNYTASTNTLSGGTYIVSGNNSTLDLGSRDIHTLAPGTAVILDGAGSTFPDIANLAVNNGSFSVTNGHNFTTAGPITNEGLLSVGPSTTFEITGPLTNTAKADIAGGTLVLDQGLAGDTVLNQLHTAWHNGAWDQNGITSSVAQADASHRTGVGYTASGTSYTLVEALYGDANLDGTVNSSDFSLLAANYGKHSQFWLNGDFNYDGTVNALDFNALATNYGQALPAGAPLALGTLVPEPASAMAIGAIAAMLARRRHRRVPT